MKPAAPRKRAVRVFPYYRRLTPRQQAIYRRSDEIGAVRLPRPDELWPFVDEIMGRLAEGKQPAVQATCRNLLYELTARLDIAPVGIRVLSSRPSNAREELHGCYLPASKEEGALITVWMYTAKRRQIVAFRSFFRTVVHEFGHHLDYTLLGLKDSFHTEGFYKRESSLFNQLVPRRD